VNAVERAHDSESHQSPAEPPPRVTIRDVATVCGVSQSTVSFVLNEVPDQTISKATRERVRNAARELGYVPNGIARALMEGSSRVVVLNLERAREGEYTQNFIRGLDKELALYGFTLLVRHGPAAATDIEHVESVIKPRAVIRLGEPYLTGHEYDDAGGGWRNGMASHVLLQLRYLAEHGHRHILFAFPEGEPLAQVRLRFASEVAALLELPDVVPIELPLGEASVRAILTAVRLAHPAITAVAAFDDLTALCLLAAMRELGLSAPADLAVIGYDESPLGELSTPALTTIRLDAEGHGRVEARRALGLAGAFATEPGRVIERESV